MTITRRTVLASTALAAAPVVGPALAQTAPSAPASAQGSGSGQAPGFYRYKVGDIEVTAINDGFAQRPLEGFVRNAELSQVQQAMQEAFLPGNALPITFNTLVLNNGGRLTLIDTGNGDMGAPTSGRWMANFRAAGFDPAQVNTVVISHFHGDHINGLRLKDGTAVFPNAEVMVPAAEWAFWMDEARMNQAPEAMKGAFQGVRRVFGPIANNVKRYEMDKEVVPGLTAVAAPGHTPGHTVYMLSSGSGKLMIMSDTTNHPALFVRNPDWSAVFDMDADQARATRRRLLDMAASERAQVAFYHAPFPATGHIAKEGNGFRFVPVQWSPAV
ncbi:glyoxylase-like metal-dependent hydrolase (beta-lactamase superfamily II) [Microvirga lupini]|uniref:Glyoxylase-like metal-dependent hydrolase (Beta-lactamase superfamily II) n=1 Tax=Microvirga lupini TaxID=420324 RepID=A0A7W4VLW1_9HYPH|nr:MBL fold metallo-hydrolase [Microvirga lupini]MBB3019587.1 glyoxylase-like metal-dependent hydrolase (beta-lactamase superfamily II) [Microvirga lupini]